MGENIIRLSDYEKRSRNPDAVSPRNPADAEIIILPVIRIERHGTLEHADHSTAYR